MLSFKQHIAEASVAGKNVHLMHLEDAVLYGGVEGTRDAINALRSLRDMLAGNSNGAVDVTVKWDGAPAVFCGVDPSDGEFFVAKKGIFNKNPKVYKSIADVKADTSGELADKLSVAYVELKKLGIKNVIQGDLMFTKGDLKTVSIEGEKYVVFQPNTIAYAVPADSQLADTLKKANLGIVFHTSYNGSSFESMTASYGVDTRKLKKVASVWYQDATIHDLSGQATLTAADTAQVTAALSEAGKIFQKISGSTLKAIEQDAEFATTLETYNNTYVRKGETVTDTKAHVAGLITWATKKFDADIASKKSEKGQDAATARKDAYLAFFNDSNKANLDLMYQLQNAIVKAKLIIIEKLDSLKKINTFVKTSDGFRVTSQEGFVAIDHLKGGAVKLVDRMTFSKNNFDPNVIKGWQK
jgi:hypothetical protein